MEELSAVARLARFAQWAAALAWEGMDVCGGDVQERLLDDGFLVEVPGGFDPDKHDDETGEAEPGETFYVFSDELSELANHSGGPDYFPDGEEMVRTLRATLEEMRGLFDGGDHTNGC